MVNNTANTPSNDHTVAKITVISVTLLLLACIVVFTTLALIIIDQIPFHHIFDGSACGIGASLRSILSEFIGPKF